MCYGKRIQWIRQQIKSETDDQIREKGFLKKPHESESGWMQSKVIARSYKITALLIMLNETRNKLRSSGKQKFHSHQTIFRWGEQQTEYHKNLLYALLDKEFPHPKLYVIVDSRLSPIQMGIQGAHAVAKLFTTNGVLDHSALVFLESNVLRDVMSDLYLHQNVIATFREPQWQSNLTALAIAPVEPSDLPERILGMPLAGSTP